MLTRLDVLIVPTTLTMPVSPEDVHACETGPVRAGPGRLAPRSWVDAGNQTEHCSLTGRQLGAGGHVGRG